MTGRRPLALLAAAALVLPAGASADRPAPPPPPAEDLVTVTQGTLPVILSAPHGGRLPIPGVPERKGGPLVAQFTTVRDEFTAELATRAAAELGRKLGGTPWLVVARFDRAYLDVNRPPDGAYESDRAKPVYDRYHAALAAACKAVKEAHGRGLLLDVHGQGRFPDAVSRGTRNGRTVALLVDRFGWRAVNGKYSVLGRLERAGYKVRPAGDAADTAKEDPAFAGGHIVATYGSHTGYGIDAVQLEFGGDLRLGRRHEETARDLADAVAVFHNEYLKDPPK